VWLDLDQAALDAAYDQTVYAPNHAQIIKRMIAASTAMRERMGPGQVIPYGLTAIERIYYYPAPLKNAPLHIHVHGGAWRQRSALDVAFPAEAFVQAGVGFAVYDFTSVEEHAGDLTPMLAQVRAGLAWFARHAVELGGDPDRLYLSGFSSGAHLAGVAITSDWREFGFERNPYRGAVLASGMYDLEPVSLSARSGYVAFSPKILNDMSAQRHIDRFDIPVILANGTYETPEFQRQTRDFAAALRAAGRAPQHIISEGYNHYEVMEMFGHPFSPLGRAALAQAQA
jgi:arylformamidase